MLPYSQFYDSIDTFTAPFKKVTQKTILINNHLA